ncbi:hypothetical protein K402DRAFT_193046 [Aulographum hederae CBS 113979]|uniref:Uncharacterized protein n=1 Tax=Aulographum hederae CBS 113979 TaxID=1176131 RepID=A0A6G1GNM5_9PEZI|nr:hypothetical protein K402DRAFT_193046 [Aulographum hederae CBS 113979]
MAMADRLFLLYQWPARLRATVSTAMTAWPDEHKSMRRGGQVNGWRLAGTKGVKVSCGRCLAVRSSAVWRVTVMMQVGGGTVLWSTLTDVQPATSEQPTERGERREPSTYMRHHRSRLELWT